MSKSKGMIWPYAIGISIALVFGACIATVIIANQLPVEKSDTYMMGYHEADAKANELLQARIDFDKEYKVEYVTDGLSLKNTVIKYKITTINLEEVKNAKIEVVVTRPNNHKHDQTLKSSTIVDGVYTFSSIELPVEGRWDIMAKISVGDKKRYFNVKADTREKEVFEY
ncbi:FixH family protein [Sulfurimonas sp.]|uniref:FixH family protein n=1 Tax=Sulfurimonas sp. TaxID=2022749 RepID=UPI002B4A6676|nr:FixH family protein [Sulfurimonas sp.]